MQQNGTVDINDTIAAWADIVLNIWRTKITELRVYNTGQLFNSLANELQRNAGGNIYKIEFSFFLYGIYIDAGVGKGSVKGRKDWLNPNGFNEWNKKTDRIRKQWFSKVFYAQIMKLREILVEKYGNEYTYKVQEEMKRITVEYY